MTNEVRYRETAVPIATAFWWGVLLIAAVGFAAGIWVSPVIFIASLIAAVVAVTILGMGRYSAIAVTSTELRVGRESIPLADIDTGFGVRRGREALSPQQQAAVEIAARSESKRTGVRIVGGAYGRLIGHEWLVVRRDGDPMLQVVATRRPADLQRLLRDLLPPDRPHP